MKKQAVKKVATKGKQVPELPKLAKRLKALRKEKGYNSHEAFAFDIGISRTQYNKYERGYDIRFSTLTRIVNKFGMTLEEFFSEGFD
jgi:transcriptional regulator with XRE-family HTH domain